jgi:hypothetical protein
MGFGSLVVVAFAAGGCTQVFDLDAPVRFDTRDAAPDLPTVHRHYVIDRVLLPTNNTEAKTYGLDLDGDDAADNQLGMVVATFGSMGLDAQSDLDALIDTGRSIMLAGIGADSLAAELTATYAMYRGINPMPPACASTQDTMCRGHLTGSARFSIDNTAPVDAPLFGEVRSMELTAGPGHLTVELVIAGSLPFSVRLLAARVNLIASDTTFMGTLAGAVSKTDMDTKVLPAMQQGFAPVVMRDCLDLTAPPGCGCISNSPGKTLIGLFDTQTRDCMISIDEIKNNSLLQSVLAPDVRVEGVDALSLGVNVHAVGATFTVVGG